MPQGSIKSPRPLVPIAADDTNCPDRTVKNVRKHYEKNRSSSFKKIFETATTQYKGQYDTKFSKYAGKDKHKSSLKTHLDYNSFPPQYLKHFHQKNEMKPFDKEHCEAIKAYRDTATNTSRMLSTVFPLSDMKQLTTNKKFIALADETCAPIPILEEDSQQEPTRRKRSDKGNIPVAYLVVTVVPNTDDYFHTKNLIENVKKNTYIDPFFAGTLDLYDQSFPSEESKSNAQDKQGRGLLLQGLHKTITVQVFIRQNKKSTSPNSPAVGIVSAASFRFDENPSDDRRIRVTAYMVLLASDVPLQENSSYAERGLATTLMKLVFVGAASLTEWICFGTEGKLADKDSEDDSDSDD